MSTIVALILWFTVICYAVFGGADYGAGFWDLTAGGARRRRPGHARSSITRWRRSGRPTTSG